MNEQAPQPQTPQPDIDTVMERMNGIEARHIVDKNGVSIQRFYERDSEGHLRQLKNTEVFALTADVLQSGEQSEEEAAGSQSSVAETAKTDEQRLSDHARWQMHVDTTDQKPSERGLTGDDLAYNSWLEDTRDDNSGQSPSLREKVAADKARQARQDHLDSLRDFARLEMRVKTGAASGEEAANYYGRLEREEQSREAQPDQAEASNDKEAEREVAQTAAQDYFDQIKQALAGDSLPAAEELENLWKNLDGAADKYLATRDDLSEAERKQYKNDLHDQLDDLARAADERQAVPHLLEELEEQVLRNAGKFDFSTRVNIIRETRDKLGQAIDDNPNLSDAEKAVQHAALDARIKPIRDALYCNQDRIFGPSNPAVDAEPAAKSADKSVDSDQQSEQEQLAALIEHDSAEELGNGLLRFAGELRAAKLNDDEPAIETANQNLRRYFAALANKEGWSDNAESKEKYYQNIKSAILTGHLPDGSLLVMPDNPDKKAVADQLPTRRQNLSRRWKALNAMPLSLNDRENWRELMGGKPEKKSALKKAAYIGAAALMGYVLYRVAREVGIDALPSSIDGDGIDLNPLNNVSGDAVPAAPVPGNNNGASGAAEAGAQFVVEPGHGISHEVVDYADSLGKTLSPDELHRITSGLQQKFGANILSGIDQYTTAGGEVRISQSGNGQWSPQAEAYIRQMLGLN